MIPGRFSSGVGKPEGLIMEWDKLRKVIASVCGRDHHAPAFTRREMLAAIGLAGALAAAPKLLASSPAEARTNNAHTVAPEVESPNPANATTTDDTAVDAGDTTDATEFSARRYYRRYYYRRRYWRRRYWRRRYWRPRYYRRRYWRRRYWRRRYWW